VLLAIAAALRADAQGFYARGDALCSLRPTAADVVAEIQALGGVSVCNNDDCDRDGRVTAADVQCAATCLFGRCAVPAHAPAVTAVAADSAPGIVPLSGIRMGGGNFGSPDRVKRVTIGGREAAVVSFDPDSGVLEVVVPAGLPPGPADVVVFDGDLGGAPTTISIAAPVPSGNGDTFDGTLGLSDTAAALLLALDLEGAFGADDASALREQLQHFRADLAAQRVALAADPQFTDDVRARFDAAFDSAGIAAQFRQLIGDIEALLGAAQLRAVANVAPTVGLVVSRFASTAALLAAEAGSTAPLVGVPATAVTTFALGPVVAIATVGALVAGAAYLAGQNSRAPVVFSLLFQDGNGRDRLKPTAGGTIRVAGRNFLPSADVVVTTAYGEFTAERFELTDETLAARLPTESGLCGAASIAVVKSFGVAASPYKTFIQPIVTDLRPAPPDTVTPGNEVDLTVRGAAPCDAVVSFRGPRSLDDDETSYEQLPLATLLTCPLPVFPPGDYAAAAKVQDVASDEAPPLKVGNPITGLTIACMATELAVPPGSPATTTCSATVQPDGEVAPMGSKFVWTADSGSVRVTNSDSSDVSVTRTTTVTGRKVGAANIHVALVFGTQTLGQSAMDVPITVVDKTPPTISISSTAGATVMPGGTIDISVMASDNVGLGTVALHAMGDAVANPEQETDECLASKTCAPSFTINLKSTDGRESTVTVQADAVDAGLNRTTSNTLTFKVAADSMCPAVMIDSPVTGAMVSAGSTVQVMATATDNGPGDTGVKTFVYSATGDALVAPVSQTLPLPQALPTAHLNFVFTVKSAADLATVMDKTITISVAAADNAIPMPNQCPAQTLAVTVLGTLDHCEGSITTDNPADYDGKPFTITVALTGDAVAKVVRVTSVNPGGSFDLAPQGNGVYTVTLFYQGQGAFTLTFTAFDVDGNTLCSGSIPLEALGPPPGSDLASRAFRFGAPAGAVRGD
jgi:hypothetical protein